MKVRNKHSLETRLEPIKQIFTPPPKNCQISKPDLGFPQE